MIATLSYRPTGQPDPTSVAPVVPPGTWWAVCPDGREHLHHGPCTHQRTAATDITQPIPLPRRTAT